MDTRPIGVFDSGLGGLSAVRTLQEILPEEDLIYFGDTARVPYGGRSKATLLDYARQDLRFLERFQPKALLVACGTVSTNCLAELQQENERPIVGVVEPTCRRAVEESRSGRIGLIATPASVRSGAYEAELKRQAPGVTVASKACPLFVPLVENGRILPGDVVIETVAREYLEPLRKARVDTLILGCTHYPLLSEIIGGIMGPEVSLISSGAESAVALKRLLKERDLLAPAGSAGSAAFYVSDRPEDFEQTASLFLQAELHGVRRVEIEQY